MAKIKLKDIQIGDKVWHGCDSGFCHDSIKKVIAIGKKYNEDTGEPFKTIRVGNENNSQLFDEDGGALEPPTMYYIEPCENETSVNGDLNSTTTTTTTTEIRSKLGKLILHNEGSREDIFNDVFDYIQKTFVR